MLIETTPDFGTYNSPDVVSEQTVGPSLPDYPGGGGNERSLGTDNNAPYSFENSPGGTMTANTSAGFQTPDYSGSPGDNILRSIIDSGVTPSPGINPNQGKPLTAEQQLIQNAYPGGGSQLSPGSSAPDILGQPRKPTLEELYAQGTMPNGGVPTAGGVPPGGSAPTPGASGGTVATGPPTVGGSGVLGENAWDTLFKDQNGFFNSQFNGRSEMLYNAARGDLVIRDQLRAIAPYDSDARKVLAAIDANPLFDQSPASANWRAAHNPQIDALQAALAQGYGGQSAPGGQGFNGRLGAGPAAGGGQAAQGAPANLGAIAAWEKQRVNEITPGSVKDTLPVAADLMDLLQKDGATNVAYHASSNTVSWVDTDGLTRVLGDKTQQGMAEWANVAQTLNNAGWGNGVPQPPAPAPQQPAPGYPSYAPSYTPSYAPSYGNTAPRYSQPAPQPAAPQPYQYQGITAGYNPQSEQFLSVVNNQPIASAPMPVVPGTTSTYIPTSQRTPDNTIRPY